MKPGVNSEYTHDGMGGGSIPQERKCRERTRFGGKIMSLGWDMLDLRCLSFFQGDPEMCSRDVLTWIGTAVARPGC